MRRVNCLCLLAVAAALLARPAAAQVAQVPDRPWSAEASIGWDNGLSGNVLSSGVGTVFGLASVIENQSYDDVYGTGFRWSFGFGYRLRERHEIRAVFGLSTVSADAERIGDTAGSPLLATFDDYQVWGLDFGYRHYFIPSPQTPRLTPYVGASAGVSVINEIDTDLAVPELNLTQHATDFYDATAAFTFELNGGTLVRMGDQVDLDVRLGLRYVTGLTEIDGLVGTELEDINDDSGRWVLPFTIGLRIRF